MHHVLLLNIYIYIFLYSLLHCNWQECQRCELSAGKQTICVLFLFSYLHPSWAFYRILRSGDDGMEHKKRFCRNSHKSKGKLKMPHWPLSKKGGQKTLMCETCKVRSSIDPSVFHKDCWKFGSHIEKIQQAQEADHTCLIPYCSWCFLLRTSSLCFLWTFPSLFII